MTDEELIRIIENPIDDGIIERLTQSGESYEVAKKSYLESLLKDIKSGKPVFSKQVSEENREKFIIKLEKIV